VRGEIYTLPLSVCRQLQQRSHLRRKMKDFRTATTGAARFGASHTISVLLVFTLVLLSEGCAGLVSADKSSTGQSQSGPIVNITAPTGGATVSGTVVLSATATDSTGIAGVQFQVDGTNLGTLLTAGPYSYSWNTATTANGSHILRAVAQDPSGNTGTSAAITVTVKNSSGSAPSVSVISPTAGTTVSGDITVTANASSSAGIASVQFAVDGGAFGSLATAAPYSQSLNTASLTNGSHVLTAIAKDVAGNQTTSSGVAVTVSNSGSMPAVSITSPLAGATVSGSIAVTASASSTVGIASVQFAVDGTAFGSLDTSSPYTQSLNTATLTNGKHTLTAVAKDTGGRQTTSAGLAITVNNSVTPPSVSITSPTAGATVSGTITVTANASSSVGIASVQFTVDGTAFGSIDTASPYTQSLNTPSLTNGSHTLAAVAKDTAGNQATSAGVAITVSNSSSTPMVSITSPVSGATVSGAIVVTATATVSGSSIAGVQFEVDGTSLGSAVANSPYSQQWNTTTASNGHHTLTATATTTGGAQATASSVVTVNNQTTAPGTGWTKISFSELNGSENTSPCPPDGFLGYTPIPNGFVSFCQEVIEAWSSAAIDPQRNRLIVWGGGHNDYGGNEIYDLELGNIGNCSATLPCLIRLDPPSPPNTEVGVNFESLSACSASPGCSPTTSAPNSRHTYDGLIYAPSQDSIFAIGGALNNLGNPGNSVWKLELSSVTASCAPNCNPQWTMVATNSDIGSVGNTSDYDPNTGLVWMANQNVIGTIDPASGAYTRKAFTSTTYLATGVIDPVHKYYIYLGAMNDVPGQPTGVTYWSIAAGSTFTQNQPTLNAACNAANWGTYPGAQWDPIDQVVVVYPSQGNVLYLLNPATWTCTTETWGSTQGVDYPQNSNSESNGADQFTFKHFAYFPNLDAYVLINDAQQDAWILHRH
jgi:hypothetical protein